MKRSIGYRQEKGWGNLSAGPLHNIIERTDFLSTTRLARGMHGMR
jgi:hypothetical protein